MDTDEITSGPRLLLVEDEYVLAVCLSEWLEDHGAQVVGPVASVSDALELLEKAPEIDLAILDINLGSETVFPVADALMRHGVPFLFASGCARPIVPERFRHVALCPKPIDPATVARALSRLQPVHLPAPWPRVALGAIAMPPPVSVIQGHQMAGLREKQPSLDQRA